MLIAYLAISYDQIYLEIGPILPYTGRGWAVDIIIFYYTSRSNRPPRTPFSIFAARGSLLGNHFRKGVSLPKMH